MAVAAGMALAVPALSSQAAAWAADSTAAAAVADSAAAAASGAAQDTAARAVSTAVPSVPGDSTLKALKSSLSDMKVGQDTVWVLITAMLVFFMNLGFALVESGLCRAKNCVNILAKNFIVFAASTVSFWVIGWGLMFGDGNLWIGLKGLWFVLGPDNSPALTAAAASLNPFSSATYQGVYSALAWTDVPLWAKFFFELVFAGTAATPFMNTHSVTSTSAESSWFAEPNIGQMLA